MAMEIPKAQKIYTTIYENFRGVDYTNDQTNIWRRRSPTGYNMLPDEAGRPFKRTGWEVAISSDDITTLVGGDYAIQKCFYFELGGEDHIIIFCDVALLLYVDGNLSLLTTDSSCCSSYERAFFFEGGGKSAFYIYGESKAWIFDGEFAEAEYGDGRVNNIGEIYIPKILIATDPSTCTGTALESFNLIGNRAAVEYTSNDFFHYSSVSSAIAYIDKKKFIETAVTTGFYVFTYNNNSWSMEYGGTTTTVTLDDYGIATTGTLEDNDKINVVYGYGVLLPVNVASDMVDSVQVFVSVRTQFDNELNVTANPALLADNTCVLYTDTESLPEQDRKAFVWFNKLYAENSVVEGEDVIRVVFPVEDVVITNYDEADTENEGTAELVTGE